MPRGGRFLPRRRLAARLFCRDARAFSRRKKDALLRCGGANCSRNGGALLRCGGANCSPYGGALLRFGGANCSPYGGALLRCGGAKSGAGRCPAPYLCLFSAQPRASSALGQNCTQNAVPLPSSLSTVSFQPARLHSFLTMASPSPKPPPVPPCDLSTV